LAPHRPGDALSTQIVRGEAEVHPLPSGAAMYVSKDFPLLPEAQLRQAAEQIRQRLASPTA